MSLKDTVLLFVLAALWGASFLFVRIAVPVLGPFPLVAGRVIIGGLVLFSYAIFIQQTPNWRTHWRQYFIIGLVNNAIPFTLIAMAQLHITAGLAALINSTTPLFSAVIAAIWIKEQLTVPKVIGLFLGIVGVGVIVGWHNDTIGSTRLTSILLMLGASFCYGASVVYTKVAFRNVNPISIATGQLAMSSLLIFPLAVMNPPEQTIHTNVIASVIGLATLSTSLAYLIYFRIIGSAGPTNAASVTLLIPFFSSLWGAIFLKEKIQTNEVVGFGIILIGLVLVTGLWKQFLRQEQPFLKSRR